MGAPRNHRSLHRLAEGKLRNSLLALSYGEVLSMVTLGCHVGHIVMDISKMIWDEVRFLHERVDGVSELGTDTSHHASLLLVEHFVCRWGMLQMFWHAVDDHGTVFNITSSRLQDPVFIVICHFHHHDM
jgi:hypothetical protein